MNIIEVHTGHPYRIRIGAGILESFSDALSSVYGPRKPKLAIVTDDIVDSLYGAKLEVFSRQGGYEVCKFAFPNGEASKNLETVNHVYAFLAANHITRSDVIVALGGGVVGDLAGFAASTWLRGIEFVQVPTTFLAMIDSSVGGKTGVDIPAGKNLVGAFWQPSLVLCDTKTLDTLSPEIFADGAAEAVKYGAILDAQLFSLLETGGIRPEIEQIVGRCVTLKRQVVEQDERDNGLRQILNFGHTFGHAVEKRSGFTVTHGKGVAIGMVLMARACEAAGLTPAGTAARIAACCRVYGLPTETNEPLEALCAACMGDKKRKGSTLTLITLDAIGKAALHPIEADDLPAFMHGEANE